MCIYIAFFSESKGHVSWPQDPFLLRGDRRRQKKLDRTTMAALTTPNKLPTRGAQRALFAKVHLESPFDP